ncbi:putative quinol monooxygenase [Algoriphagus vanfongensis]|uniref:putative quinol monooxygenase n=1 Tax=Algoriphagus vanfongensis TaxID=426371 RepID=UPI0003FD5C57|nr:putative quinol monooxygenase [Algoriphagus vanfongensis]
MKNLLCLTLLLFSHFALAQSPESSTMIRIAELEISPEHLDEYLSILKKEAEASVRLEPGVICIYPMYEQEKPTQIRLLEIYSSREAYESHLKTPHFLEYKNSTLHMVQSLRLIDMSAIDPASMSAIFRKINP